MKSPAHFSLIIALGALSQALSYKPFRQEPLNENSASVAMDYTPNRSSLELVKEVADWPYFEENIDAYKRFMQDYYYFMIDDLQEPLGYVHKNTINSLQWANSWDLDHDNRFLILRDASIFEQRTKAMQDVLWEGHVNKRSPSLLTWKGKQCPVISNSDESLLEMDTQGLDIMGVRSYGVHLIARTLGHDGQELFWVQRRSMSKPVQPGKLDVSLGGSLNSSQHPLDTMIDRAAAEANISSTYLRERIKACGTLSYTMPRTNQNEPGCQHHTQYLYEIEIDKDVTMVPMQGETDTFELMTLEQVRRSLDAGEFKSVAVLVWMSYFIRHGALNSSNEPDLAEIDARLHRKHYLFVV